MTIVSTGAPYSTELEALTAWSHDPVWHIGGAMTLGSHDALLSTG